MNRETGPRWMLEVLLGILKAIVHVVGENSLLRLDMSEHWTVEEDIALQKVVARQRQKTGKRDEPRWQQVGGLKLEKRPVLVYVGEAKAHMEIDGPKVNLDDSQNSMVAVGEAALLG